MCVDDTITHMTYRLQTAFIAVALLATTVLAILMAAQVTGTNQYTCNTDYAYVNDGDTITRIAARHCEGDLRAAAHDITELNGGTLIYPTSYIQLPA